MPSTDPRNSICRDFPQEARLTRFIGLYWTLPVPWAAFTDLGPTADEAAKRSRTIRYQRERVRRHVAAAKGELWDEKALMELKPDRASPETIVVVERLKARAKVHAAHFVYVDFAHALGWRKHPYLEMALADQPHTALTPDPLVTAEFSFDPVAHFRSWREAQMTHTHDKDAHRRAILDVMGAMPPLPVTEQARRLNNSNMRTHTGKPWSAENLRKFLAKGAVPP